MPAPHPLAALRMSGPEYAIAAEARVRALLTAHGGDVRAAAAALEPPVHEITLHGWLTTWGLRAWVHETWPDRKGTPTAPEKKSTRRRK